MVMTRIFFALPFFFLLESCSSTYNLSPESIPGFVMYDEFNAKVGGTNGIIILITQDTIRGANFHIFADSLSWTKPDGSSFYLLPITAVHNIIIRSHEQGGYEGAGIGMVCGVLLGMILSPVTNRQSDGWFEAGIGPFMAGFVGAVSGGIIGGIVGYSSGHKIYYQIPVQKNSSVRM